MDGKKMISHDQDFKNNQINKIYKILNNNLAATDYSN